MKILKDQPHKQHKAGFDMNRGRTNKNKQMIQ